jgi:intracellular sulfur oxidation DsrE/DsrF family protein
MKNVILILMLLFSFSFSQEVYKAVFDCSSSDARFVLSRLFLIQKTAENFKEDNLNYKFEITMHGGCVLFLKKKLSEFPQKKRLTIQDIQHQIEILKELYGVKIKACNIALSRFNLKREDIVDFVDIVKNSWQEIIILQNKGYALVPFE